MTASWAQGSRRGVPAFVNAVLQALGSARDLVVESKGWRRCAIAFLAGALSNLAMAPFFVWPVLFLTLPVLVWLLDSAAVSTRSGKETPAQVQTLRAAARDGWWFGFGYFLFGLYWIGEAFLVEADTFGWLMPFAVTLMPAGLAVFTALAMVSAKAVWTKGVSRILVFAAVFAVWEWIRGHVFTGFPWNVLGYAFTYPLELMQSASLVGVYGLTPWVVLVCATPVVLLCDVSSDPARWARAARHAFMISVIPLAAMVTFGHLQLSSGTPEYVDGVKLRLVQPSVPQREKWLSETQSGIFADHINLSKVNANGRIDDLAGITHVIWPEASMPFLPLREPVALRRIGEMLPENAVLIAGALRVETEKQTSSAIPYDDGGANKSAAHARAPSSAKPSSTTESERPLVFNSLMAFDSDGRLASLYDKTHLVPFGEYLPFREMLEAIGLKTLTRLRGGFEIGPQPRPLKQIPGLPTVGPLICYEAIFPGDVVEADGRPGVLVNLTNDGWFGTTTGPYQHFHQSRVRAVEEGVPLIRSANNGISAVVDPFGRVLHEIGLDVRGTVDSRLPRALPPTLVAAWHDVPLALTALVFLGIAGVRARRR